MKARATRLSEETASRAAGTASAKALRRERVCSFEREQGGRMVASSGRPGQTGNGSHDLGAIVGTCVFPLAEMSIRMCVVSETRCGLV